MGNYRNKQQIGLAGEFAVASELLRRGYDVNVTLGNAKAVDLIVTIQSSSNATSFKTIEVKTTKSNKVVTNFFQKYGNLNSVHPDYWVLVHIDNNNVAEFFILTHQELGNLQMKRNKMTTWTPLAHGCDNVLVSSLIPYQNCWNKIH